MNPKNLTTRIFLDGSDPEETESIIGVLGFLDGQTTNPTLFSKNPRIQELSKSPKGLSKADLYAHYNQEIQKISAKIPKGSVSIEVYSDKSTSSDEMLAMGREMFSWIPNAHIKFPTTREGLVAAQRSVAEGMRVNLTLCFSQEQAAAVYGATKGAKKGQVFVSPFVGRLDDRGENGMDLIANIMRMFKEGDGHVEVLSASLRTPRHLLDAIDLGSDILTAPFSVLKLWSQDASPTPDTGKGISSSGLRPIFYKEIDLNKDWKDLDIHHELTEKGIEKFSADWNALVRS
jgi:transaldolase